jgi:2'-5' RNA ligase
MNNTIMKRCFIAVEIPADESIQKLFSDSQQALAPFRINWVKISNIHLTLRFLGNCTPTQIESINHFLPDICQNSSPQTLSIKGIGVFPSTHQPTVLWAGLQISKGLFDIQEQIEENVQKTGFLADNKAFRPHLTLGRIKEPPNEQRLNELIEKYQDQLITSLLINKIQFMESRLFPGGPEYSVLGEYEF